MIYGIDMEKYRKYCADFDTRICYDCNEFQQCWIWREVDKELDKMEGEGNDEVSV